MAVAWAPEAGDWPEDRHRVSAGEAGAREALFASAYDELRRLARARLRGGGRNTVMGTTVLVHECFLRFTRGQALQGNDRRAFFAYASRVMRSVIVDAVRERQAQCRGGGAPHCPLNTAVGEAIADGGHEVLRVHEALAHLAATEPRLAQVVEMRYFMGSSEAEVAEALGVTDRTVRRDWDKARMLLAALLG